MSKYRMINVEDFDRKKYFNYFNNIGSTIELTAKLDVTAAERKCKEDSISFHAYVIFKIYNAVNLIKNFRLDYLNGNIVEWEAIIPTFTILNRKSNLFLPFVNIQRRVALNSTNNINDIIKLYGSSNAILLQGNLPSNIFIVSCIPWMHFEHFSSNSKLQENQTVKMIAFGKYKDIGSKLMMPVTMQVSHAIIDGYHVSEFFEKLQHEMNEI